MTFMLVEGRVFSNENEAHAAYNSYALAKGLKFLDAKSLNPEQTRKYYGSNLSVTKRVIKSVIKN